MLTIAYRTLSVLLSLAENEDGQTLTEYAVLIGFIAIVVLLAAMFLGNTIVGLYHNATGAFASL